jgi:hypothetical protein
MKKLFLILIAVFSLISFTASGRSFSSDKNIRNEKKLAKQEKVKEAVESKRFAIELNRLHMSPYGTIDLTRGRNYIIISGNKASVSAGYIGRQRGLTPVEGVRLTGNPSVYKLEKNDSGGTYRIGMEVTAGGDTFHITMTIRESGYCDVAISAAKIDYTRYTGSLVPLEKKKTVREPDDIRI